MSDRALTLRLPDQVTPGTTNYQGYTLPLTARNVLVQVLVVGGKYKPEGADGGTPSSDFITLQPNQLYRFPIRDGIKQAGSGARIAVAVSTAAAGNIIEVMAEE